MEFILTKDTAYVGNLYLSEMGRPSRNKIILDSLSLHVEVKSRKSHADETNKEAPVSEVSKIILDWVWVFLNSVNWSKISSPLWSNSRVQEFLNSSLNVVKVWGSNNNGARFLFVSKGVSRDNKAFLGLEDVFSRNASSTEGAERKKCEYKHHFVF